MNETKREKGLRKVQMAIERSENMLDRLEIEIEGRRKNDPTFQQALGDERRKLRSLLERKQGLLYEELWRAWAIGGGV